VLLVVDGQGNPFKYDKNNPLSRSIQEMLFNEKRKLIEECLFGVDINSKAVAICQLRLWIELLKNAYYKNGIMETLPNIDINIKRGNSLISSFQVGVGDKPYAYVMGEEASNFLKKYKAAVKSYKSVSDKPDKLEVRKTIDKLLSPFRTSYEQHSLIDDEVSQENKVRENSFEWMVMFPEVLSDDGTFLGFDVVIGNPPYISAPEMVNSAREERKAIKDSKQFSTLYQKWDLYIPFMELGLHLLKNKGIFSMIVPYPLTNQIYAKAMRELILGKYHLTDMVDLNGTKIFDNATVSNCIPVILKENSGTQCTILNIDEHSQIVPVFTQSYADLVQDKKSLVWNLTNEKRVTSRHSEMNVLGDFCYISVGMVLNADEKKAKGAFSKADLISETQDDIHCRKYIDAKDIERYSVKRIRYLEYGTERCPSKLRRSTFKELYDNSKLMFNRLGRLAVYYDENNQLLHSDSMYSAVLWSSLKGVHNKSIKSSVKRYSNLERSEMVRLSKRVDLRYLLGILNSEYAAVLLTNQRGGDYHIYPEHVRNLPIPLVAKSMQNPIIKCVDKILVAKQADPTADTSALEKKIDKLVYALYGLTDDEIAIVEGVESNDKRGYVEQHRTF
jgi:hypothetical protein